VHLKRYLGMTVVMFIIWLLIAWPYDFISNEMNWQSFIIGLVISIFVGVVTSRNFVSPFVNTGKFNFKRILWFIYYILLFMWLCLKANLDVAYRVLHPQLPINPGIVKVKTNLKSPIARVALTNSITLTPGTLSVDITDDGYIYIHWIYVASEDIEVATQMIVSQFERILIKIFE